MTSTATGDRVATPVPRAGTTSGSGALLRFMLRRERYRLPWWLLGAALLVYYQSVGSQDFYDTPEKLARQRELMGGNPAIVAMSGPKDLLATVGGEAVFEVFAYMAIVIALMNMFLVGRHTRSDEETGRAELIRSARVGRHAPLAAALALAGLADLMVGVAVFAAAAASGLPLDGSALLGAASAGVGISFAGLAAVAVQVFDNPRSVYSAVGAAIGAAYVLRAVGDAGTAALSWLSPIGWGQQTLPFVDNRWQPLLLPLVFSAGLAGLAVALLDRRDFGGGLLRTRPGPAYASPALGSPLGLAWRLHRASFLGWATGIFLLGAALGSFVDSIEQFVADNAQISDYLPGGAADAINSYLALIALYSALLAAAYGISSAMRARAEESTGRAEPVLATRTSRPSWLASHLAMALAGSTVSLAAGGLGAGLSYAAAIADPGQIPRLVGVALAYAPATWLLIALAVLGFGWLPRAGAAIAWAVLGFCALVTIFADLFKIPDWIQEASPYVHTPQVPLDDVAAPPLVALAAIVAAFVAAGFAGFRRRDVG